MHQVFIPSLYVAAGLMIYATFHYSAAMRTPRDLTQIVFGVVCFLSIPFAVMHAQMLQAGTAPEFIGYLKYSIAIIMLLYIIFPWFIAMFSGKRPRFLLEVLSIFFAIIFAVNLASPFSVQYEQFDNIYTAELPWGEIVTRGKGQNGFWTHMTLVGIFLEDGFLLYALISKYRSSRRPADLGMLLALAFWLLSTILGILSRLSIIKFVEPGPLCFVVMIITMSTILANESKKRLRTSENQSRSLFDNSPTGMAAVDPESLRIIQANQSVLSLFDYSAEEMLTKTVADLTHPDDADPEKIRRNYEQLAKRQINQLFYERRYIRKDGSTFIGLTYISALRDDTDKVTQFIGNTIDITHRKESEEEIKHLAFFDHLTDLPNRRLMLDRLHQAQATSARTGHHGALLIIDADDFKTLNDTHGHVVGDALLKQLAERLKSCVRETDTVARLGGDEFVLLLENMSPNPVDAAEQTKKVVAQIRASLTEAFLFPLQKYRCTLSTGATLFKGQSLTKDELIKQADIAMYQAKKAGRNTLRFFDPQMQEIISSRATLEDALHKALEADQFHLYYQIQVDSSYQPLGAEALIRWAHPERGLMYPNQFIPLAEETELILPIGKWVLETACSQIKAWESNALTRNLVLSVNVSAKQFKQPDFISQVQETVRSHAINPALLKLELTESMLVENIEDTVTTMNALNGLGVQFSLDDFGTGYSSLQYLKRLPLAQIKIDQSFVRGLVESNSDQAIVRTIIAMTHSLNLMVIAEGVETEDQRSFLVQNGCESFQGYLFGKPVPAQEFEEVLLLKTSSTPVSSIKTTPLSV